MISLWIAGTPVGKGRPRFAINRTYTPRQTELAESEIRRAWEAAGAIRLPDDQAVELAVTLVVDRPQAHFKRDGSLTAEGLRNPIPRNRKPDVDNALKLVMDSLNSRAYRDDVQVAEATVRRTWSHGLPGTAIVLRTAT